VILGMSLNVARFYGDFLQIKADKSMTRKEMQTFESREIKKSKSKKSSLHVMGFYDIMLVSGKPTKPLSTEKKFGCQRQHS
jgi:hypothetical protein